METDFPIVVPSLTFSPSAHHVLAYTPPHTPYPIEDGSIKYTKVLAIDPGLKNTWMTSFIFTDRHIYIMEKRNFNFENDDTSTTNYTPCPDKGYYLFGEICDFIKDFAPDIVLMEFQPPIGYLKKLIRCNCWVEGFLMAAISATKSQFQIINPSAVRSKMKTPGCCIVKSKDKGRKSDCKTYLQKYYPKEYAELKDNEHCTDCFLMALYWMGWLCRND